MPLFSAALPLQRQPQLKMPGLRCAVQINCEELDEAATILYGMGRKRGILYWLRDGGTLLLNNVDKARPAVMPLLQRVGACMFALWLFLRGLYVTNGCC